MDIYNLIYNFVSWWMAWIDPWFWVTLGVLFSVVVFIGISPTQVDEDDAKLGEVVLARSRKLINSAILAIAFILPLLAGFFSLVVFNGDHGSITQTVLNHYYDVTKKHGPFAVYCVVLAYVLSFSYSRFVLPKISSFFRRFRVRQSGESLSDIRTENVRLKSKNFNPSKFYKNGSFFLGLDKNNKPVYIDDKEWKTQNQKVIGPTQTGKGVNIGVQVDQAIRKGMSCIVVDPKSDKHLKHIMHKACLETQREFICIDLNNTEVGVWAPFSGGGSRDRRARLMYAFGLDDSGQESDYYKVKERQIVDQIFASWDGGLGSLNTLLHQPDHLDDTKRIRSYVTEWLFVKALDPPPGQGLSISRCIEEGAVVYIQASITDLVVIKAATIFIMEVVQETMRLYSDGKRSNHLFFVIDEVRFMISEMLANALATVTGFDANLLIAYQSILDIRNLRDKRVNPKAIEQSVNVNCKITLCYMTADTDTADWAAGMSGVIQKTVTRFEKVKVERHGAEVWDDERSLAKTAENLIHQNVFRMLPERTGVFFVANKLARILYTCWIPVDLSREIPFMTSDDLFYEGMESGEKGGVDVGDLDEKTLSEDEIFKIK